MPQEADWGGFYPVDDQYTLTVLLHDSQGRLGQMVVKSLQTGMLIRRWSASRDGRQLKGAVQLPWEVDYVTLEVSSRDGQPMFALAATNGLADRLVLLDWNVGFVPYRPAVIESAKGHVADASNTPVGNPYQWRGVFIPSINGGGAGAPTSWSSANADAVNDDSTKAPLLPPPPFQNYIKRNVLLDTLSQGLDMLPVSNPVYLDWLIKEVKDQSSRDTTPALSCLELPPYSLGSGYWNVDFSGTVIGVLAVPYRRTENVGTDLNMLLEQIRKLFKCSDKSFTEMLLDAAEAYLRSEQNRSGYFAGDLLEIGNLYRVDVLERYCGVQGYPLTQEVTFQLAPDIAPPAGWPAYGQLSDQGAWTTPPPPGLIDDTPPLVFDASGKATLQLNKGWRYEVSGAYEGYEAGKHNFDTPVSGVISVPCLLKVLLILKVYTTSPDSGAIPANITITDVKGNPVMTGTTQSDGKGNYVFSNPIGQTLSPGEYTITATSMGPPRNPGTTTITVSRGVEQEVTVQLGPIRRPPLKKKAKQSGSSSALP
ncbi:carboxypeptidase-like regulatory domain-containing protein [Chthonomonas calidirosea]|uniref:carboxypeptidase-like regulatory domain-containing protein n=1 Tax=Chthonomonas calidirosea TaxID=454171 RepID=UPI0012E35AE2|nr:carboxypeptidase-like regulatory domain-containing protein [Chthonomonas calidirosea]